MWGLHCELVLLCVTAMHDTKNLLFSLQNVQISAHVSVVSVMSTNFAHADFLQAIVSGLQELTRDNSLQDLIMMAKLPAHVSVVF